MEYNITLDKTLGVADLVKRIGYMFYVVDPAETTFKQVEDVPNYIDFVSVV